MERLKLVLQYFQSNSESISNGICIILALVSVKLYTSFDFNCPCLPQYNKLYSLGVMIVPPIILFFLGVLVNRHTGVMMDEWMRPVGNRSKNPAVVKYLFSAMIQRALLAPMVWILVTLLDGKIFICAFSVSVDPALFSGLPNNTGLDVIKIMAKVPCKEDIIFRNTSFRKAVSRYVRCYSQMSTKPKSHKAMGEGEWMVRLRTFASSGVWPAGGGNRSAQRQRKWHDLYQKIEKCPMQACGQTNLFRGFMASSCGFHTAKFTKSRFGGAQLASVKPNLVARSTPSPSPSPLSHVKTPSPTSSSVRPRCPAPSSVRTPSTASLRTPSPAPSFVRTPSTASVRIPSPAPSFMSHPACCSGVTTVSKYTTQWNYAQHWSSSKDAVREKFPNTEVSEIRAMLRRKYNNEGYAKAVGWSILLFLIVLGAMGRLIKPCFDDHATFLQTRYWSNYLDVEQKLFDETCVLHARDFARKCVVQFFEDMREDTVLHLPHPPFIANSREEWEDEEEDRLHGISKQDQMDQLLNEWYYSKPELDVTRIAHRPRTCVTWENPDRKTLYSDV